jgi:hypothetical protein
MVIAVRQQTQPNLSHPSKWNGGLGSTQAGNPTQSQSTNHSQANWPIEGYINQESATRRERKSKEERGTVKHIHPLISYKKGRIVREVINWNSYQNKKVIEL